MKSIWLAAACCGLIVATGCDTKHQNPPGGSGPAPPPVVNPDASGHAPEKVPDESSKPSIETPKGESNPMGKECGSAANAGFVPEKIANAPHLPNPYRIHEKVITGGLPDGDEGFRELKDLGIKTIISVDGATPDVALAKKYDLRYVHLPHGYDGVPAARGTELAKAVKELPGPIYIHCHQGKHRSPAAGAVACIRAGLLPKSAALMVLMTAGTSPNYRGLYQSAEEASPIDPQVLDDLKVEFKERLPVTKLALAMTETEHFFLHLKKLSENKWQLLPNHPAVTPAHEALLLREAYTEMLRTDDTKRRLQDYQEKLQAAEATAEELEKVFLAAKDGPLDEARASALFATVTEQCSACHKTYRDVPLREKGRK